MWINLVFVSYVIYVTDYELLTVQNKVYIIY
jgi:hypothetical protein